MLGRKDIKLIIFQYFAGKIRLVLSIRSFICYILFLESGNIETKNYSKGSEVSDRKVKLGNFKSKILIRSSGSQNTSVSFVFDSLGDKYFEK